MQSINPATGEILWSGDAADVVAVDRAVNAAREAFPEWARRPIAERIAILERFRDGVESAKTQLAETVAQETGKPLWDSASEIAAMIGKIAVSLTAYDERTPTRSMALAGGQAGRLTHRPHGVLAVFGPYNFPAHLPNGHIVPALLAGNCVVFKPSELTPLVAEQTLAIWKESGLPDGVLTIVQGERATGEALAAHPGLDGLLFTGSSAVGETLHRHFAAQPHKILALEMGGNNPLIVWDCADHAAVAYHIILSAFISSGQRCTCARRLILPAGAEGDAVLDQLIAQTRRLTLGAYTDTPEPFMGPLARPAEVETLLARQAALKAGGAATLLEAHRKDAAESFVTPGILDVTHASNREDSEIFGPLLQVVRVASLSDAIDEANATRYGLAAAIFSDDKANYERCLLELRAGLINWNRQTTGASSALPFGGIGASGNHRPAATYAADYCAYPVASLEAESLALPASKMPGM